MELADKRAAEFGFDSNYFQRADSPDEDPIGALRLRITPSFSLSTLGPQRREGGGRRQVVAAVDGDVLAGDVESIPLGVERLGRIRERTE